MGGASFRRKKASEVGGLKTVGPIIHSRRPRSVKRSNPPTFSDLSEDSVFLPAPVDYHHRQVTFTMALAGEMGRHGRFVNTTMGDVEMVSIHLVVERLSGLSHILETTPPALY